MLRPAFATTSAGSLSSFFAIARWNATERQSSLVGRESGPRRARERRHGKIRFAPLIQLRHRVLALEAMGPHYSDALRAVPHGLHELSGRGVGVASLEAHNDGNVLWADPFE